MNNSDVKPADELRYMRLEAEADLRPSTGPCLGCGVKVATLVRGRRGGFNVYCPVCAIATRTPSMRGAL
jgi:hypothetical protein